ncbi:hypothetical protein OIU77_022737 [Salix suchowensis]|uniref:DNA-3-methyladenine glycosylase I n=1 Tax=Salix suchowensis TaxID=1278906 RepID=A0ABQ9C4M7_9ROSI|nr:hypothetical protein OIU77_022737 [Salix suchowensis]
MCSFKSRLHQSTNNIGTAVAKINGRPVLQPKSNQVPSLERSHSLKRDSPAKSPAPEPAAVPPIPLMQPAGNAAGSIAAARREHVAGMQEQRKMRIAHYGRTKSAKYQGKVVPADSSATNTISREEKRCSFITPNSDPIYVAYHDEEWGVPVHDDKLLFELLVLTGAQVGSDWTSVLKKREAFREAFSGFDAEVVARFTEKKIASISAEYGIDTSQVRAVVDNSNKILEVTQQ